MPEQRVERPFRFEVAYTPEGHCAGMHRNHGNTWGSGLRVVAYNAFPVYESEGESDIERELAAATAERDRLREALEDCEMTILANGSIKAGDYADMAVAEQKGWNDAIRFCFLIVRDPRAALTSPADKPDPDITKCPRCGGPADQGYSRDVPPLPYECSKCAPEMKPCPSCRGTGEESTGVTCGGWSEMTACERCEGTGSVPAEGDAE